MLWVLRMKLADVLEYTWFINLNSQWQYHYTLGDKDTHRIAFAVAGKLAAYNEVSTLSTTLSDLSAPVAGSDLHI